uniref:Uncharacterized protein n=1 Tax=Anguilla anguilla TaxID=7936 RepID=A0A0E9V7G9_ANGAN
MNKNSSRYQLESSNLAFHCPAGRPSCDQVLTF